jgi:hypothetical protein
MTVLNFRERVLLAVGAPRYRMSQNSSRQLEVLTTVTVAVMVREIHKIESA